MASSSTSDIVKHVVFIRHGHSLGQAAPRHLRKTDPGLVDCSLSAVGRRQAHELAKAVNPALHAAATECCDADVVSSPAASVAILTSPLTRALLTTSIVFHQRRPLEQAEMVFPPIVVLPMLAEVNSNITKGIPENTGRHLRALLADEELATMLTDPLVDLSHVEASSWPFVGAPTLQGPQTRSSSRSHHHHSDSHHHRQRLNDDILNAILTRPEPRVIVVAHFNLITSLLQHGGWRTAPKVENCTPIHAVVMRGGDASVNTRGRTAIVGAVDGDGPHNATNTHNWFFAAAAAEAE